MNTVVPISTSNDRLEIATRWVVKLEQGLSGPDRTALEAWLDEDARNAAEFLEVAKVWDKSEDLSRLADLFPKGHSVQRWSSTRQFARPMWAAAAAVVTIAAVVFSQMFGLYRQGPVDEGALVVLDAPSSYETAVGEQSTVTLPDGTVVVLNTNSRIGVGYSRNARVINLERGEIHVDVAEESTRPLSVVAGNRIVQAVGTAFSVEITANQRIELVVTEGKVIVGVRGSDAMPSTNSRIVVPPVLSQNDANTVAAGEETVLGVPDEVISPVSAEEIEVKLSWRKGRLIFRSEPLEQALGEVQRYTMVEFILVDDELKSRRLSGRFRAGDVEALLASLRLNFNITYEYDGENRVLLRSL